MQNKISFDVGFLTPVYIECQLGESLTWQAHVINFAEFIFDIGAAGVTRPYFLEPENLNTNGKKVVHVLLREESTSCIWQAIQILALTILFPVGLFALAVKSYHHWDGFINSPYDPLPYQPSSLEPEIITEYRPDFSVKSDNEGRLKPIFLVKFFRGPARSEQDIPYEEIYEIGGLESYLRAPTPVPFIRKETTSNRFFTLCEKDFKDYKLHHASMDNMGMNALTMAAYRGNIELLEALIETAPDLVNLENEHGLTPLMFACMHEDQKIAVEMANLLIENGADVNLSTTKYHGRENPATATINKNSLPKRSTALYIATLHENEILVDLLLRNDATLDHKENALEETDMEDLEERIIIHEESLDPKENPAFYNLTDEYVKYLFKMSSNVTWEKCMPLVVWKNGEEKPVLPNDIIDLICQIYNRATIFWR